MDIYGHAPELDLPLLVESPPLGLDDLSLLADLLGVNEEVDADGFDPRSVGLQNSQPLSTIALTPSNLVLQNAAASRPAASKKEKKKKAVSASLEKDDDDGSSFDDEGPSLADCASAVGTETAFPPRFVVEECANPDDPKEVKKHRRLIRNRESAALHRERKKAYIDKLEADIAQRDAVIAALRQDNAKLRQVLTSHGIPCVAAEELSEATTHEDSEGSDGTSTPEPRVGAKRSEPGTASTASTVAVPPAKRLTPGSILCALACLMIFKSPSTHITSLLDAPSTTIHLPKPAAAIQTISPSTPRTGGRVLMSILGDDHDETALVPHVKQPSIIPPLEYGAAPSAQYAAPPRTNASTYFFCPSTLRSMDDIAQRFNSSRALDEEYKLRQRYLRDQQLRRRVQPAEASTGTTVVAARRPTGPSLSSDTSVAISKLLLAQPGSAQENETATAGPVVVRSAQGYHTGGFASGGAADNSKTEAAPHLMLVVPSSTLEGFGTHSSGWVEIGCSMQSARFVDFSS